MNVIKLVSNHSLPAVIDTLSFIFFSFFYTKNSKAITVR
jgi:hypothetical protein